MIGREKRNPMSTNLPIMRFFGLGGNGVVAGSHPLLRALNPNSERAIYDSVVAGNFRENVAIAPSDWSHAG